MTWLIYLDKANLHEESRYNSYSKIHNQQITDVKHVKSEKGIEGLNCFAILSVGKYFQLSFTKCEDSIISLTYMPFTWLLPLGCCLTASSRKNCCHPPSVWQKKENILKDLGKRSGHVPATARREPLAVSMCVVKWAQHLWPQPNSSEDCAKRVEHCPSGNGVHNYIPFRRKHSCPSTKDFGVKRKQILR